MGDDRREKTVNRMKQMSPEEFAKNMPKETREMKSGRLWEKIKRFFNALGIGDDYGAYNRNSSSSSSTSHESSSSDFRQSYRADTPPRRTHEDWVREQIAREAYMQMVDGKGDHDCGHEH